MAPIAPLQPDDALRAKRLADGISSVGAVSLLFNWALSAIWVQGTGIGFAPLGLVLVLALIPITDVTLRFVWTFFVGSRKHQLDYRDEPVMVAGACYGAVVMWPSAFALSWLSRNVPIAGWSGTLWLCWASCCLPLTLWLLLRHLRRVCPVSDLCPRCGYDLRATPGRCPECGRVAGRAAG